MNIGAADSVRRAGDNTRDELRLLADQVNALYRQIKGLHGRIDVLEDKR